MKSLFQTIQFRIGFSEIKNAIVYAGITQTVIKYIRPFELHLKFFFRLDGRIEHPIRQSNHCITGVFSIPPLFVFEVMLINHF